MKTSRAEIRTKPLRRESEGNGSASSMKAPAIVEREPRDQRALLRALQAVADGDFSVRLPGDWTGLDGKIADRFNDIVAANQQMAQELARVGEVVGSEGKTQQRMRFARSGAWGEMQVSVNTLIDDLVRPTTEVTRAVTAVAQGNLLETCASTSRAVRSRANSCAPRRSSTR